MWRIEAGYIQLLLATKLLICVFSEHSKQAHFPSHQKHLERQASAGLGDLSLKASVRSRTALLTQ